MGSVDLLFPVRGTTLPIDHAYALYGALSGVVWSFHDPATRFSFAPIGAQERNAGVLRLAADAVLRCRPPSESIAEVLPLAGKTLQVGDHSIHLGPPRVMPLLAVPNLSARLVTFKHATEPERFLEVARQKLTALGIAGEVGIPLITEGPRRGELRRKVLRIKDRRVIGFGLLVTGLTAEESIRLQENGLGGRTRLGCGFFVPWRPKSS
jgi:CRISPR-associated protein Cas6